MTTIEYIDALRAHLGLSSDYQLARELRVTRSAVSKYRTGQTTADETTALRIAELLNIDPARVLADVAAERSRTPEARTVWRRMAQTFVAVPLFVFSMLGASALLHAAQNAALRLYIMLSWRPTNGGYSRFLLCSVRAIYTRCMRWIAAACFACFSLAASATDLSLNVYGASYHTDRAAVRDNDLRELHPGAGIRRDISAHTFLDSGIYRDSWGLASGHAGVGLQTAGRYRVGALVFLGYRADMSGPFVGALPFVSARITPRLDAHAAYVPRLSTERSSIGGVFFFSYSYRLN